MDQSNAALLERLDLTVEVAHFRIRPDDGAVTFESGQYIALGLPVEDRLVQRPYSTASAWGAHRDLEFFIRRVTGGALTPALWAMTPGARLRLGRPKGLFTLLPEDRRTHLFLATGTGVAPFVSMLETLRAAGTSPPAVIVHGVAYVDELGYRARFERWAREDPTLTYVPTVSRQHDPRNAGWRGRTGRLDAALDPLCDELGLDPHATVAYLCGNPAMIATGERILHARGFPPEAIRSEHYWPLAAS